MHTCDVKLPPVRVLLVQSGKRYHVHRVQGSRHLECGYVTKTKDGWLSCEHDGSPHHYAVRKPSFRTAVLARLRGRNPYVSDVQLNGRAEVLRVGVSGVWFTILYMDNGNILINKDTFDPDANLARLMRVAVNAAQKAVVESVIK